MRIKKLACLTISLLAMVAMTACNIGATPAPTLDVNAIYTSAAATLLADFSQQQTQTALAVPPTAIPTGTLAILSTPITGFTPQGIGTPPIVSTPVAFSTIAPTSSGPLCNNSVFVADVTVPDGTIMKPGNDFEKIWEIQNTGTCSWGDGYVLKFVSGDNMDGYDLPFSTNIGPVKPGAMVNLKINMTAHIAEGTYSGCWKMKDDKGYFFGTWLCYKIQVKK